MNELAQKTRDAILSQRLAVPAMLALLAIAVAYRFSRLISHDVGWMLTSANQLLDGAGRLYRDIFFEVNPPLALFLKIPAVTFARATDLFEVNVFIVYVFLLSAGSILLAGHLLSAARGSDALARRLLLLAVFLSVLFLPGPEFGQREHFLIIFTLPYLVLIALHVLGQRPRRWAAILCGVFAALGFALKPHFLIVPVALELYALLHTRRISSLLRAETIAMAVTGVGYAVLVVIFTPEYLTGVLPLVMEFYNDAVSNPLGVVLFRLESFLVLLAVGLQAGYRRHQDQPAFGDVFAIASVCLYAVYLSQMKGWHYHALPCLAATVCTFSVVLAGLINSHIENEAQTENDLPKGIITAFLCGLVLLIAATKVHRPGTLSFFAQWMMPIVEEHAPEGMLYALSTNVWTAFPAVNYSEASWGSRYSMLWLLPGVVRRQAEAQSLDSEARSRLTEVEEALRETIIEDLLKNRPDLIVLDDRKTKAYFGDLEFDYVGYLSSDPRFRALWSGYEQVDNLGPFLIYRRSGPGTSIGQQGAGQDPALRN